MLNQSATVRMFISMIILSCSAILASAQSRVPDRHFTLDQFISEALENNQSLKASVFKAQADEELPEQAATLADPRIMFGYQPIPLLTARGVQRFQFQFEQDIPYPGKLDLKRKIQEYTAIMANHEIDKAERLLIYQVKVAYFELYSTQEQLLIFQDFRDRLSDLVASASSLYKLGNGAQQDVLKAQLERNRLDEQEIRLKQHLLNQSESMARLLGRSSGSEMLTGRFFISTRDQIEALSSPANQTERRYRPEILIQEAALSRSEQEVNLAEKMYRPDFTAGLVYYELGESKYSPMMTGRDAIGLQLKLKLPIWRNGLKARKNEAQLRMNQNSALLQDLRIAISTQIQAAHYQLEQEVEMIQLYEKTLIPQAELALKSSLSAYSAGQSDFMGPLDSERVLFELRMSLIQSRSRALQDWAALDWAQGDPTATENGQDPQKN